MRFGAWVLAMMTTAAAGAAEDRLATASQYMDALRERAPKQVCIAVAVIEAGRVRREISGRCKRNSLFQIGSITKTFTGLLLADAVGRDEVALEDEVAERFGSKVPRGITYRELATHTSGLPRLPGNLAEEGAALVLDPYASYGEDDLREFLRSAGGGPKGTAAYSNLGMGLLGFTLGQIAGGSFDAAVAARVTGPLGLRDTQTEPGRKQRKRVLPGHNQSLEETPNWGFEALAGAGALYSSLDDMVRYARANLTPTADTAAMFALAHAQHAEAPELGGAIGLGFLRREVDGRLYLWHNGMTGGHASFLGLEPGADRAVVVLSNAAFAEIDAIGMYLGGVMDVLPDIPTESQSGPYAEYVGRFVMTEQFKIRVTTDGNKLFLQATAQPRILLEPIEGDQFQVVGVPARVTFGRGADGSVDWLLLNQGGITQRAIREGVSLAKPDVTVPAATLAKYVGKYRLAPRLTMMITHEGDQLFARVQGQPKLPVYPKSQTRFFFETVVAEIEFSVADGAGEAHELTLHQNGVHKAPRSK